VADIAMIRTHAIRGILIGSSGLKRVRFANIDPNAIEDIILLELGFANTNTALADDYTIVPLGFANIDAGAIPN
jgi:hypothetical protein